MFLSDFSIKRPVTTTVVLLVMLIFGLLAYFGLPYNMIPEVKIPIVTVQTLYPGSGPKEIETQVTKRIEDAVATVSGIDYIESYSMENVSYVILKFKLNKDADIANQEVKDKIDAVLYQMPGDSKKPTVSKIEIGAEPVMELVLTGGKNSRELYEYADKKLKNRFSQIDGVAKVDVSGGQKREIRLSFKNKSLLQSNLSMVQFMQIIGAQNLDLPSGNINQGAEDIGVRVKGEVNDLDVLRDVDVATPKGVRKLSQLADVNDSETELREKTIFFDTKTGLRQDNVIRFSLNKSSDGNTVAIAKNLKKILPQIEKELPAGYKLNLVADNSTFVQASVEDTMLNLILGIILTAFILLIFLHDARSTLIVVISMPLSIISTFMVMKAAGFSLNAVSLLGLSTSVGTLVAKSIVVLENIFRHKDLGEDKTGAARIGTSEVTVAVLATTLADLVVFLPIGTMSSMVGQIFKEFGLTVVFATIISLFISFTLTPMLASLILPEKVKHNRFSVAFDVKFDKFTAAYRRMVSWLITSKKRMFSTIGLIILVFFGSLIIAGKLGFEFMPTLDQGEMTVKVELPQGTNLEQTAKTVQMVQEIVAKHPEVKHIVTSLGSQGDLDKGVNLASLNIKLVDANERDIKTTELNDIFLRELAVIPNARILCSARAMSSQGGDPVEFYLRGQDVDKLEVYKKEILNNIRNVEGLNNLNTSTRDGKPEINIYPKRDKLAKAGITVYELALMMRSAIEGMVATQYKEGGEEYDMKIVVDKEYTNSITEIQNLPIMTPTGSYRLSQLANVDYSVGVNKVVHRDKAKTVKFSAGIATGYALGDVVNGIKAGIDKTKLPKGYDVQWGGNAQLMNEAVADLLKAAILAILLTYFVLAATLESFRQPILILSTIPLALIGIFGLMYITGQTMNIFSMMAIIMLFGIVANNAILILDHMNMMIKRGTGLYEALLESCGLKLKPIVMSNLAIIVSMLPMAMGVGADGKEFRQSMGIVSIGGILTSTIMTLFLIPILVYLTSRKSSVVRRQASGEKGE